MSEKSGQYQAQVALVLTQREHRTGSGAHDFFSCTAEKRVFKAGVPVRGYNDQVGLEFFGDSSGAPAVSAFFRNARTGHGAWRTTRSATLPISRCLSPE